MQLFKRKAAFWAAICFTHRRVSQSAARPPKFPLAVPFFSYSLGFTGTLLMDHVRKIHQIALLYSSLRNFSKLLGGF
jgi:hypothetical protein